MNIAEFHFIRPYWLLAVIPYIAILVLMFRSKLSQGNWSALCDAALLPYILQEKAVNQSRWPLTAGAIAALLAIVALAGPTWERLPSPVFRNESALVIALDLSRSMDAADIKPTRLVMARYKITDILKQRKDGQTALLVYAGDAFTVTPLTDDTETIDSQLSALNSDIMPSQGSNTVSALEKAVELLQQAGLQKGRILLVTDGVDVDKSLATVKSLDKYRLSILGVGTDDGAPIALLEGGFLKNQRGDIVVSKLNSGELAKLAQAGNGVYQTITANDADIQTILANVDQPVHQQDKPNDNLLLDQWADKGPWLLLPVLLLAALAFRKGLLCFALLLILPLPKNSYALGWQDLWQTKDQQAQQAYKKQDFAKAAEQFENPDWKAAAQYKADQQELGEMKSPKTATGFYNQGNVLAKSGRYEEAVKAYEKALAINPNDADAKHNKDVIEKELKKQQDRQKDDKQQSKDDSRKNKDNEQSEKSGEQNPDQNKNEEKPEQKPERKQSDQQQPDEKKQQQDKAEEKKPETEKPQQAEQRKDEAKRQQQEQTPGKAEPTDEQQQANEQWLNRIPDDPAGLLRRKFKYQYGQRDRQSAGDADDW